jgi:hypothetical protein
MSDTSPEALNMEVGKLEQKLLRNEQHYFEQLNQQALQLEETSSHLQACRAEAASCTSQLEQQTQRADVLARRLDLAELQLRQAQEELATTLQLEQELTQWEQRLKSSPRQQLQLLTRTLMARGVDQLRWVLPIGPLRRHKAWLYRLLGRER